MRILLDECVPWPIQRLIPKHSITSVQAQGWSGIRNSDLIRRAESEFELLITADQSIRYQHNLEKRSLAILELSTNDLRRIRAAAALLEEAVEGIKGGEFQRLEIPS